MANRTLIQANLRLVVTIAEEYRARGLPILDLVQEGNLGPMHAVERFDWRRGFDFSNPTLALCSSTMRALAWSIVLSNARSERLVVGATAGLAGYSLSTFRPLTRMRTSTPRQTASHSTARQNAAPSRGRTGD